MRWVVPVAFAVFALIFAGSQFTNRFGVFGRSLDGTATPSVLATPSPSSQVLLTPGPSPKVPSPAVLATASATLTALPRSSATPPRGTTTPSTSGNDLLYLVNRQNSIPSSYEPGDLVAVTTVRSTSPNHKVRRIVLPYLEKLMADAKSTGFELVISSAYRSYSEQEVVHAYWEKTLGKAEADRVSAIAGQSEHQLGTTVDLTSASVGFDLMEKFGSTPEGKWLRENAYRYGFVISYPEGKEAATGYAYEPWHLRYVGLEHATIIYQKGITLDEYLRSRR